MSVTNNIISAPVSIDDVNNVLGHGSTDLGTLCKSSKINKWARWKPVQFSKISELTEKELMSTKYGLVPQQNTKLLEVLTNKKTLGSTGYSYNDLVNANTEWDYNRPTSYYRLTDFLSSLSYGGYNHNTSAPIDGFGNHTIYLKNIPDPTDLSSTTGTADTNSQGVIIRGASLLYSQFKMRFSNSEGESQSWQAIGGADPWIIPINSLLGSITTGNFRLALAIAYKGFMKLIVGSATLKELLNNSSLQDSAVRWIAPNFFTNADLYYQLKSDASSNKITVSAIPCIVEDAQISVPSSSSSYVSTSSLGSVYSMPKGRISISITIEGGEIKDEKDYFKVITRFTGEYINMGNNSSTIFPLYEIGVIYEGESNLRSSYKINATWTYTYQSSPTSRSEGSGYITNKVLNSGSSPGSFIVGTSGVAAASLNNDWTLDVTQV